MYSTIKLVSHDNWTTDRSIGMILPIVILGVCMLIEHIHKLIKILNFSLVQKREQNCKWKFIKLLDWTFLWPRIALQFTIDFNVTMWPLHYFQGTKIWHDFRNRYSNVCEKIHEFKWICCKRSYYFPRLFFNVSEMNTMKQVNIMLISQFDYSIVFTNFEIKT